MKHVLLGFLLLTTLAACTSESDLGAGKTGKSFTVNGYSYDAIWNASLASLQQTKGDQKLEIKKDLSISEMDKSRGIIRATTGVGLLSWGEVVGVYISPPHEAPAHVIEVESRAKMQTNVFSNNWEDELIESIKGNLAQKSYIKE